MMSQIDGATRLNTAELDRIRCEYNRRDRDGASERYSWIHAENQYNHTQLWRSVIGLLAREGFYPLRDLATLDVGCGRGSWLIEFVQWGADPKRVSGIDIMPDRIASAKRSLPQADVQIGDASQMPWPDNTFNVVFQFTVFTSVLDADMRRKIASEMLRVVKPEGVILWYDFAFDNPKNTSVKGIREKEVRKLFSGCEISIEKVTLAPPLARRIVPVSWIAASILEKLPFLRTHLIGTIRKKS